MRCRLETQRFRELLEQLRCPPPESDLAAWELVRCYTPSIQMIVRKKLNPGIRRRLDSMDCVQNAWASLIRIIPRLGSIDEPEQFIALMATIACRRLSNEQNRTKDYEVAMSDHEVVPGQFDLGSRQEDPSFIAMAREKWEAMLSSLPERHRAILQCRVQGMTFEEIAEHLGISERNARRIVRQVEGEDV